MSIHNTALLKLITSKSLQFSPQLPYKVQHSCTFFLDLSKYSLDDVKSDGNGSYKNLGTFKWNYRQLPDGEFTCTRSQHRDFIDSSKLDEHDFVLYKIYFSLASDREFKRVIMFAQNHNSQYVNGVCVVKYHYSC